jgi:macrolide transport system ATP-binding/permease protein
MALLEFRNINKVYQIGLNEPLKALDNVNLDIDLGEYVAIIGPSGSGKSTLLQIMGLLDPPSSGSYRFMSKETASLDDDSLTELRAENIGFIFQLFNLLPRVSVEENIVLPTTYRGAEAKPDWIQAILQKLGLEKHRMHTPAQLSGGQQQRVAIGRALINRPKIILADEPTGNLPRKQALEIIGELEKLHAEEGITLLIITHDPTIAERADRMIQIVDGQIVSDERKKSPTKTGTLGEASTSGRPLKWNWKLWVETFHIALQSLARNKVRSFLTMLGVIIGVFSVISMLAIGEGARKDMEYSLRQMGSNLFRITPSRPSPKGLGLKKAKKNPLSWQDYDALTDLGNNSTLINAISASVEIPVTLTYGGNSWSTIAMGVDSKYERLRNYKPVVGRFFNESEDQGLETLCVLGRTAYENLFVKNENPVGKEIKINLKSFRVLGVLPEKGSGWGEDEDDLILIPIQTAMKKLYGVKYLSNIFVQAKNETALTQAIAQVRDRMRDLHSIDEGEESDFKIKNFAELKKTIEQITGTMTKFIAIVALISLIVGGIGIMNIMLVSVTERTREIGVRKAIGAKRRDILMQFLIESMMIGSVGGIIGVVVAVGLGMVMKHAMDWEIVIRLNFVVVSFFFSWLVGVFFGLYPAYKASKLSPIHALRYE